MEAGSKVQGVEPASTLVTRDRECPLGSFCDTYVDSIYVQPAPNRARREHWPRSLELKVSDLNRAIASLEHDFAFVLAIPIMDSVRVDLDQHETRCINPVLEPALQALGPMRLELRLVAYQLGFSLNGNENRWLAEQALASCVRERDFRVAFDIGDRTRLLPRKENESPSYPTSRLLLIGRPAISPLSV